MRISPCQRLSEILVLPAVDEGVHRGLAKIQDAHELKKYFKNVFGGETQAQASM